MASRPLLIPERECPPCAAPVPAARPRSVRRGLLLVALIWAATRLLVWACTYYGTFTLFRIEHRLDPPIEKHVRRLAAQAERQEGAELRRFRELFADLAPLCRFDGVHYRSIVTGGYHYAPPPPGTTDRHALEQNIAFFPLFPLLARLPAGVLGPHAAMVLVAHLTSLAAGLLLYLWLRQRLDDATALWAVALTFTLPPAVYYSYAYAEGLTLLLITAALWLLDQRRFAAAAVVSGLATAARPTALATAGVWALAWWFNAGGGRGRRAAGLVGLGGVACGGILAYALFLAVEFGSPLVYLDNFKAGWVPAHQRSDWLAYLTLTPVWEQFKYFRDLLLFAPPVGLVNAGNTLMWNVPLTLFLLFLSLGGLGRVERSFRPLLALGPLIFLHAYLASGGAKFGIEPIARYMAVSVPAVVVLAAWSLREWRPAGRCVLLVVFVLIQAAWAYRFGMQEWSG